MKGTLIKIIYFKASEEINEEAKKVDYYLGKYAGGGGRDRSIFCSSMITTSGEARSVGASSNILKATLTISYLLRLVISGMIPNFI